MAFLNPVATALGTDLNLEIRPSRYRSRFCNVILILPSVKASPGRQ
jgi:hypothetical protein